MKHLGTVYAIFFVESNIQQAVKKHNSLRVSNYRAPWKYVKGAKQKGSLSQN